MSKEVDLHHGDCLELMKNIPDKSIDMVLTDPPYGTTTCKWDTVIPFEPMWNELKRITKDNGAICLFSKQPFTSNLIMSNPKMFKYPLIWKKDNHDNPLMAKKRHLNITEDINVFYAKQCHYYPQGLTEINKTTRQGRGESLSQKNQRKKTYLQTHTGYPNNVLDFKRDLPSKHPTQKPVALLEYLIKTYTLEGETVLDFTMGSGSTGAACKNLNRKFIGIEKEEKYFNIAKERINVG
jgi:site-specific DNA-methyltransferase (adenine-specific)